MINKSGTTGKQCIEKAMFERHSLGDYENIANKNQRALENSIKFGGRKKSDVGDYFTMIERAFMVKIYYKRIKEKFTELQILPKIPHLINFLVKVV